MRTLLHQAKPEASDGGSGRRAKRSSLDIDPNNFQMSNPSGVEDFSGFFDLSPGHQDDVELSTSQQRELADAASLSVAVKEEQLRVRFCDWYGKSDEEKDTAKLLVSHSFDTFLRRVEVISSRDSHPSPAVVPKKKHQVLKKGS